MTSGRFNQFFRTGSQKNTQTELILQSLNAQRGTFFDTSYGTAVEAENFAYAKAINELFETNQRFANQSDPQRMTDFLSRWEAILKITPVYGSSDNERRRNIAARLFLIGSMPNLSAIRDLITAAVPQIFIQLHLTPSTFATVFATDKDSNPTHATTGLEVSGGITAPYRSAYPIWSSSISYIAVEVSQPSNMTDIEFARERGTILSLLDDFLPAWCTFATFVSGDYFTLDSINLDTQPVGIEVEPIQVGDGYSYGIWNTLQSFHFPGDWAFYVPFNPVDPVTVTFSLSGASFMQLLLINGSTPDLPLIDYGLGNPATITQTLSPGNYLLECTFATPNTTGYGLLEVS